MNEPISTLKYEPAISDNFLAHVRNIYVDLLYHIYLRGYE